MTPLYSPPPTLSTLTDEDRASALYTAPGDPGGSDFVLVRRGHQTGVFDALRKQALFHSPAQHRTIAPAGNGSAPVAANDDSEEEAVTDAWRAVEVRYVWCDRSIWEIIWGVLSMRGELADAKKAGKAIRHITFLRLERANHFVSIWLPLGI